MSNVYFRKINNNTSVKEVQKITQELLDVIIEKENVVLEKKIPLKVHFGEKGNNSFLKQDNYTGIINYLEEKNIEPAYIETSVMYGGYRHRRDLHEQTAKDHGFDRLPIIFADGEAGEAFYEVEINKNHFDKCKLGKDFQDYSQLIILAHFKGHRLAGFGGAIKQLSMGHASKGGKLAMHTDIKPKIVKRKCKKCNLCKKRCNEDAIFIGNKPYIDHDKCVGCGACVSICPAKAVSIFSVKSIYNVFFQGKKFGEKLVEYAYAAQKDKNNIYFNFAMNVTKVCDCEPKKLQPIMDDFGIFVSTDPVAIDKACLDMAKEKGQEFKGSEQLAYAERIGFGSSKYNLIEL